MEYTKLKVFLKSLSVNYIGTIIQINQLKVVICQSSQTFLRECKSIDIFFQLIFFPSPCPFRCLNSHDKKIN